MEFITKNLKQAGIFNTALIVVGLAYDVFNLFNARNVYNVIAVVLQIVAYCFALNYAFKGYKKSAAKSFKMFLYAFALSMITTMAYTLINGKAPMHSTVFAAIRLVCVVILAFGKDLGKTKSYALAGTSLLFATISVVKQLTNDVSLARQLITSLSAFILSAVLFIFIVAKYKDKESRVAK